MASVLHIDIETYSPVDLTVSGVYKYSAHPYFKVLMLAWAVDDDPVQIQEYPTPGWVKYLLAYQSVNVAHNAQFEMTCLREIDTRNWCCTMNLASQLGWPARLEDCALAMGLTNLKDSAGKKLIKLFGTPNKEGGRNSEQNYPLQWELFKKYCKQDVEVEREIYNRLKNCGEVDKELWDVDQRINRRGVAIDRELVENAITLSERALPDLYEQLMDITGLNDITDAKLKQWLSAQTGDSFTTLSAKEMPSIRAAYPQYAKVFQLREQLTKTSIAKYTAMQDCVCEDGRVRGLTQYMGAGRTGRWAGRLIQLQNLPRITKKESAIDAARRAVKNANSADGERVFTLLYGHDSLGVISQLIRTALVPKEGHAFVVADFSAIEARVLAWLADEQWRLDVFNTTGKIYETSAERMFNLKPGSVDKSSPYRQKGKVAELALGYGGSVGALTAMGALQNGLTEEELPGIVALWRKASPAIVNFWGELDQGIKKVLAGGYYKSLILGRRNVFVKMEGSALQIWIPSGRALTYQGAEFDGRGITYMGMNQMTHKWEKNRLYGAKATENITQALARDCLADVLVWAENKGLCPVFHVHDELICEVEKEAAERALEGLLERMKKSPLWGAGLPLKGDGFVCDYYCK